MKMNIKKYNYIHPKDVIKHLQNAEKNCFISTGERGKFELYRYIETFNRELVNSEAFKICPFILPFYKELLHKESIKWFGIITLNPELDTKQEEDLLHGNGGLIKSYIFTITTLIE